MKNDPVNNPAHYTQHPSGIECYEITQHLNAPIAQVIQYVWRSEDKDNPKEDLQKAIWWLECELSRLKEQSDLQKLLINTEPNTYKARVYNYLLPDPIWIKHAIAQIKDMIDEIE